MKIIYLFVTETTSIPKSQFPLFIYWIFSMIINNHYLILSGILFIEYVSIKVKLN